VTASPHMVCSGRRAREKRIKKFLSMFLNIPKLHEKIVHREPNVRILIIRNI